MTVCLFERLAGIFSTRTTRTPPRKTQKNGPVKQCCAHPRLPYTATLGQNPYPLRFQASSLKSGDASLTGCGDIGGWLVGTQAKQYCYRAMCRYSDRQYCYGMLVTPRCLKPTAYSLKSQASSLRNWGRVGIPTGNTATGCGFLRGETCFYRAMRRYSDRQYCYGMLVTPRCLWPLASGLKPQA